MAIKASCIVLLILLIAVGLNSIFIHKTVGEMYDISIEAGENGIDVIAEKFERISEIYKKNEVVISLTVSHEDLRDLEEILAEINGAIIAKDEQSAKIAKSRFENALQHLIRLSSLNIESIF